MASTLADQLDLARQAIEEARRRQDEEYQKDLEALERVSRFLPSLSTPSGVNGAPVKEDASAALRPQVVEEEEQSDDREAHYLISAVLDIVLKRPNMSLSPRDVFDILESQNFPFTRDESKRILSVAQALRRLTERDQPQVRLVRRGSGRRPNTYRAVVREINPAHATAAARLREMTM
jgi:hypothetical protein